MKTVDVVIVGAGPYGLSLAAHLRSEGIPYQIYGTPLESWSSFMPEGMHLKSEPFASNLWDPERKYTLERFSAEKGIAYQAVGKPVPLSTFLEYAEWFRKRTVGETIQVKINRIRAAGERFVLERADGETVEARRVVLATGYMSYRTVPRELTHLTEKVFLHSSSVNQVKQYAGRDVTIIGAGQSAIETAAILHEAGAKVRLVVRKDRIAWNAPSSSQERSFFEKLLAPESGLGVGWKSWAVAELPRLFRFTFAAEKRHRFVATSWGPSGSAWLRDRVEGKVNLVLGYKVRSAIETNGRVRLTLEGSKGFQEIVTDQVIAATGFRIDFDRIPYLDSDLKRSIEREGAVPLLSSNFETSVPNLFVIGITSAPTFGPVMRFMFGAKHAAPIVARRLKALANRETRHPALKLLDVKAASES